MDFVRNYTVIPLQNRTTLITDQSGACFFNSFQCTNYHVISSWKTSKDRHNVVRDTYFFCPHSIFPFLHKLQARNFEVLEVTDWSHWQWTLKIPPYLGITGTPYWLGIVSLGYNLLHEMWSEALSVFKCIRQSVILEVGGLVLLRQADTFLCSCSVSASTVLFFWITESVAVISSKCEIFLIWHQN